MLSSYFGLFRSSFDDVDDQPPAVLDRFAVGNEGVSAFGTAVHIYPARAVAAVNLPLIGHGRFAESDQFARQRDDLTFRDDLSLGRSDDHLALRFVGLKLAGFVSELFQSAVFAELVLFEPFFAEALFTEPVLIESFQSLFGSFGKRFRTFGKIAAFGGFARFFSLLTGSPT